MTLRAPWQPAAGAPTFAFMPRSPSHSPGVADASAHFVFDNTAAIWTPHRPQRAWEKLEGGRRFKLVSDYEPAGDQPTGHRRTGRRPAEARAGPGAARRHRLGQDLHHGEGDRGGAAPRAHPRAEQDAGRPALWRVARASSRRTRSSISSRYYDYYQPEAYVPRTDTYIEKESNINEQIDRMRHAATRAILERDDVIIVASVSCIYGIGSVETYTSMTFTVKAGDAFGQQELIRNLVATALQAQRSRLRARLLPRPRRHHRALARAPGGPLLALLLLRRRDREHRRVRSAHRASKTASMPAVKVYANSPLRHPAHDARPGRRPASRTS